MGYVYAVLWIFIAMLLFVRFKKESKIVYPICLYFLFLGGWWLANEFISEDLLKGSYSWILRAVSVGVLTVCIIVYFLERKKFPSAGKMKEEEKEE
ncbi:MAG: hypothetical protein IJ861_05560 [Clostridia bacterium]|nr:hypothetical protein [Clostridia bacterium]